MKPYLENSKRGTDNFPFSYYKEHLDNRMIELHWHPEIELIYIIDGKLVVTVSEEKFVLEPGDIFLVSPEELHFYTPHTSYADYHVAVFDATLFQFKKEHFFEQDFTNPLMNGTLKLPRIITRNHPKYDLISPIVYRLFHYDIQSNVMIFADLMHLFCTFMEHDLLTNVSSDTSHEKSEDIRICINYMEENYTQKVTLAELADLVHMSPNYFCNYFKKQTGISPFTKLNSIRINRASKLLLSSDSSIIHIAGTCGFENVSFFIRKFKEVQGCTPSSYRKIMKNNLRGEAFLYEINTYGGNQK